MTFVLNTVECVAQINQGDLMNKRFMLLLLLIAFVADAGAVGYKPSVKASNPQKSTLSFTPSPTKALRDTGSKITIGSGDNKSAKMAVAGAVMGLSASTALSEEEQNKKTVANNKPAAVSMPDKKQESAPASAPALTINTGLTKTVDASGNSLSDVKQRMAEKGLIKNDQPLTAAVNNDRSVIGKAPVPASANTGIVNTAPQIAAVQTATNTAATININSDLKKGAYEANASGNSLADVKQRIAERELAKQQAAQPQYAGSNYQYDYDRSRERRDNSPSGIAGADFQLSVLDKIMLYATANNAINAARDAALYRAHYNDPEVVAWRNRMQSQASGDPELAARLKSFEDTAKKSKKPVRLCAGVRGGMYASRADSIALSSSYPIEVVYTNGTDDNIGLMKDGKCDIAITQNNLTEELVKTGSFTQSIGFMVEPLMLACKRDYRSIDDVPVTATIAVPEKTGSSETLNVLQGKSLAFSGKSVISAITINEAIDYVSRDQADCVFFVAHPESMMTKAADNAKLHLVAIDYKNTQADAGLNAYKLVAIDGSHFGNLDSMPWTPGIAVESVMLVNNNWLKGNRDVYSNVYDQMQKSTKTLMR